MSNRAGPEGPALHTCFAGMNLMGKKEVHSDEKISTQHMAKSSALLCKGLGLCLWHTNALPEL